MYSVEEFKEFTQKRQGQGDFEKPLGFAICRVDVGDKSGKVLQCHYPLINWGGENLGSFCVFEDAAKHGRSIVESKNESVVGVTNEFVKRCLELFGPFMAETINDKEKHKNIQVVLELRRAMELVDLECSDGSAKFRFVTIFEDAKCESVESAYLKLSALSLGRAPLRTLNLDGIFGLMTNCAWSGNRPIELAWLRENEIELKMRGEYPSIDFVDKFPRYLMHIVPQFDNIRLLDTAKTRFGAYLGSGGYTQMPGASYVNFNAGAMGACMNEGRISSSVIVGEGTDVGGGASILGVLSGGNAEPITIGKNCLLGVNSSTGISLGDGCIVDGGVAVLAGTVFAIYDIELEKIQQANGGRPQSNQSGLYKGKELSGLNGIHFRQDSRSGAMIAFRSARQIELNEALH